VIYRWRCHPERMRAIAAFDHEQSVVTAGRGLVGGKQAEVLRCWCIASGTAGTSCFRNFCNAVPAKRTSEERDLDFALLAGVQYSQHRAKVTSIVALPGACPFVASRDKGGEIHLWSSETGNQAALLANTTASPSKRSARELLETDDAVALQLVTYLSLV